jgi:ubiquinone/menaquinone biosynthesis C-methylase UbiE
VGFYEVFAEHYDLHYALFNQDLPFFLQHARDAGKELLEFGAGTGRLTIDLAREGFSVTGVDLCRPMLERARKKLAGQTAAVQQAVTLVEGDVKAVSLGKVFDMAYVSRNVLLEFPTAEDQRAVLANARRHLKPGGKLVLDLRPGSGRATDEGVLHLDSMILNPATDQTILTTVSRRSERLTQTVRLFYVVEEIDNSTGSVRKHATIMTMRPLSLAELTLMLEAEGFKDPSFYGDYDHSPLTGQSPSMLVVARSP